MAKKIDNIRQLKEEINVPQEPTEQANEYVSLLSPEKRQEVVEKIDLFLTDNNLQFYEALLGFTDLFNTIFINALNDNIKDEDEIKASDERINDLRVKFTEILNDRKTNFIAEDMIVLMSLLTEAVIISVGDELSRAEASVTTEGAE